MAMGDKKKTEQQTKEVTMESQQESGESSTPSGERKNATEPQDGHQRFQSKQVRALEETGAENNYTVARGSIDYKPKEMQQKCAAEAEKSLTPGMTSQKECDDICDQLISMITSALGNKFELSRCATMASQYTSQCDANIQQLSTEFAKLVHEINKVFSKQEIRIEDLHRLSSMLGHLEEKMNMEGQGDEASTVKGVMIPIIRNELKNKEKLCELLYHLTQYTSQYPTDIQQTRPELRKFADEMYKVFSRPKNLAQGIDGLLPMLENLRKKRKIEDADEDLHSKEDMPVIELEKPCNAKTQQSQHSADFEDKKTLEVPESTHAKSASTIKDLKEYLEEDEKKIHVTTREEEDGEEKVVERKAYKFKGFCVPKNTTEQDEEDEILLEPHLHDVDEGSKDGGHINTQRESLPVSSEEQSPSLTQGNELSTSKERVAMVNASVQTEGGVLLHKETQVSAKAEVGTDCPPAEEEDDVVGSEDGTEAATSAQIKKKDEEVCLPIQNEVKKSYAEVVKSGGNSCSKVKQQQPEGMKKKGDAGHSSPTENINSKGKQRPQLSPPPTTPTIPLSAPREKPDKEGWQLVKGRCSSKPRAEKEQAGKKFDSKDLNPFRVLMVDTEDQQESENISDTDDNTAPGTEESESEELGASCSATRVTRDQKTRKNRKRASKKKTISSKEGKDKMAWGKPTSTTGGGQASASRQQKDEMKKEESTVYSLPKASGKSQTKQRPLELSQPPAVSTSLSDPISFQPPLDSKQTQLKGRYSSKDVGTTDLKKKKFARGKRGKSQSGNISDSKQEEKQVRAKRRPNTTRKVDTAPIASIPRSTRGRESRSRKRTMVDVHQRMRARLKEGGTTMRYYRRVQDLGQLRKTGPDQAVRPKQNIPNKLSDQGRLNKPQPKAGQQNTRGFLQTTKPEKIAIVTPFEPNTLNNAMSSQRRRNIRCPDFGTIRIEHNLLSPTSDSSDLPSSLRQDGLYNNMRGRTDHRVDFWQSGLSAIESARHWAGGHTADRERRIDSVLTQLLSGLPDQNISPTRDTTAPNEDITMPQYDVSYIGQEAEQLEDSLMYVLSEEEESDEAPEGEMSQQVLQPRTLCHGNTSGGNHSTHDPNPSLGSRDPTWYQRQGVSVRSAREELNSQGSGQVSSPRRSGRSPSEAAGPTRSVQNASRVAEADHHGGRPPEVGHVTPNPRIGGTNSWQGLSRYTDPRDLPEVTGRIASCDGVRPVCRVKPIQQQVPVCSCNSLPANQLDQEHIFSPSPRIQVLNHAGQHLCTRGSPSPTPVQEFARSIHSTVFRELVLTSFTLRCPHNNAIPWNTMLGYQDTTVQVIPTDGQASWTWRIVKRPDGRCEEEHIWDGD